MSSIEFWFFCVCPAEFILFSYATVQFVNLIKTKVIFEIYLLEMFNLMYTNMYCDYTEMWNMSNYLIL